MRLYKQRSLIPDRAPPAAEHPAAEPDRRAGPAAPVVAEDATPPVVNSAPTPPPALPDLWTNGRWAVTENGLESRTLAGDAPRLIDYPIEAERLLRLQPGQSGVSSWAVHPEAKSWVDDPDALVEGLAHALRIHHPGQTAVDLAAGAEAARTWARSHLKTRAPRDWTANFPAQHRETLLRHGMNPDDHAAARAYDNELIQIAEAGLTGQALDDAAGALWDRHFFEREMEEEDMPAELEFLI